MSQDKRIKSYIYDPINDIQWKNLTADFIKECYTKMVASINITWQKIVEIQSIRTFNNTIKPAIDTCHELSLLNTVIYEASEFHPNQEIIAACLVVKEKLREFYGNFKTREDIYNVIKEYTTATYLTELLTAEQKKYVDCLLQQYIRNGFNLGKLHREKISSITTDIGLLSSKFQDNLNKDDTKFYYAKEDLKGIPDNWFENADIDKETNKYIITLKPSDVNIVLEYVDNSEIRKIICQSKRNLGGSEIY